LALDATATSAAGNAARDDRDLKLEAARVYLVNKDANRAIALLQQLPAVNKDLRREGLLLAALTEAQGVSAAEAELARWLAAKPRDAELLELAAIFHAQRGEMARARADSNAAIALNSKEARIFVTAARVEYAGGNPTAAANYLEKALALDPNNPSAHVGLAELALRAGDLAAAERRLEAYRSRDAKATAPRLLLARLKMQRKQPADADRVLREAVAIAPENAAVRLAAGNVYAGAGRYDEAVAQFKTAAQLQPNDATARLDLARAQSALGQAAAARESLEAALRLKPDWPAAVGALALLDLREGGREGAVRRIEELERKQPKDAAVALLAGDIAISLADYPKAASAYGRAGSLEPTATAAIKAYRARRLGQLADPARPLEDWLAQHPQDPMNSQVRLLLAEFFAESGNTKQAIAEYERLIAVRATPAVLNNLAWAYRTNGDRRALETAKRAYAMAPKVAAIADTYGWILLESGDIAAGAKVLKEATELDRNDPDISYHYAAALSRRGDAAAAKVILAKLVDRPNGFSTQAEARRLFEELSRRP
jgi:putative PEP-CTERM system TPR-repeat lipoprotein